MVQKSTKQAWLCLQYTKRRYNYHMAYIAQQIKVGPFILPNRFVMGSMHTGLEGHQDKFNELAKFYADRALGGAALIITGGFSPNFQGRIKDEHCTIDTEEDIIAHKIVTSAVHRAMLSTR